MRGCASAHSAQTKCISSWNGDCRTTLSARERRSHNWSTTAAVDAVAEPETEEEEEEEEDGEDAVATAEAAAAAGLCACAAASAFCSIKSASRAETTGAADDEEDDALEEAPEPTMLCSVLLSFETAGFLGEAAVIEAEDDAEEEEEESGSEASRTKMGSMWDERRRQRSWNQSSQITQPYILSLPSVERGRINFRVCKERKKNDRAKKKTNSSERTVVRLLTAAKQPAEIFVVFVVLVEVFLVGKQDTDAVLLIRGWLAHGRQVAVVHTLGPLLLAHDPLHDRTGGALAVAAIAAKVTLVPELLHLVVLVACHCARDADAKKIVDIVVVGRRHAPQLVTRDAVYVRRPKKGVEPWEMKQTKLSERKKINGNKPSPALTYHA